MDFVAARANLVEHLAREIRDNKVLAAMSRIPRELFVPPSLTNLAYEDEPLPIGHNQTISQPYIVALMTKNLLLEGTEKVLELGLGSGYQAAILAELSNQVVSVERLPELIDKASLILTGLGYTNIEMHAAEETLGWKQAAPYDAIIVTAAAPTVPQDLLDQLVVGGRMVIPVGGRYSQELLRVIKTTDGTSVTNLGSCRFVPLIGKSAFEEAETPGAFTQFPGNHLIPETKHGL